MVKTATSRANAAGATVQFSLGDIQQLSLPDESVDRVNCARVLVHVDNPQGALNEMARVLAPGGRIVIFEPDIESFTVDNDNLETAAALRQRFTAGVKNPALGQQLQRLV